MLKANIDARGFCSSFRSSGISSTYTLTRSSRAHRSVSAPFKGDLDYLSDRDTFFLLFFFLRSVAGTNVEISLQLDSECSVGNENLYWVSLCIHFVEVGPGEHILNSFLV